MNEDLMYQCIDIIVDYVGLLLTEDQFTERRYGPASTEVARFLNSLTGK